jgi:hemerythrin
MDKELEKQFEVMDRYLRPEAEVHTAVIELKKLMKMFYEYMKVKFKETNERTRCF